MAEENEAGEEETVKKGGKGGLILGIVAVLIAAIGGFVVYKMFIAPKFMDDDEMAIVEEVDPSTIIPANPVNFPFETSSVNLMREGDESAAVLLYKVTFECSNDATVVLIEKYKPRFINMINNLHASRTRDEVDDILQFKKSVQAQAKQKANDMLKQMTPVDHPVEIPLMVTGVFHDTCMAHDGS